MPQPHRHAPALLALIAGAASLLLCGVASADAPQPSRHSLTYKNLTVVRYNPLGFQNQTSLEYRNRLFPDTESIVLRDAAIGLTGVAAVTPAMARAGVEVVIQPLSLLKLGARWELLGYYGALDHLQSFDDARADWSDSEVERRGDQGLNYATHGWQFTAIAELRLKLGPVAMVSHLEFMHVGMRLRGADRVWVDPMFDLLAPRSGWAVVKDTSVVVFVGEHLVLGARYSLSHVFYPDDAYTPGSPPGGGPGTQHRLGPLAAWKFFDEPGAVFDTPTLILILNWYLAHPHRAGQDVHQGVPYAVLAFSFTGDLL